MPRISQTSPQPAPRNSLPPSAPRSTGNLFEDAVPVQEMSDTGYKFLIFGESGSGKTTLGCDFPKPLLLIRPEEVEDGTRSVRTVKGVVATPPLRDPDQLLEICEGQRRTQRYKSILLDGLTDLQDLTVKKHMGFQDVPVQQTWGQVPQADWNRIGITMKQYLRELMRLAELVGTHIILVGGERMFGGRQFGEGEQQGEVAIPRVMVALTPGIAGWVHKVCDYNIHTFKRQGTKTEVRQLAGKQQSVEVPSGRPEFGVHLETAGSLYSTKFRCPKGTNLPSLLVDPTFAKIDALIKGK